MHATTEKKAVQPVYLITTKRAQQLARYPDRVIHLVEMLGISHEFAADTAIEVRIVILFMLRAALLAERQKRDKSYWQYSYQRNMALAEEFGQEWTAVLLRKPELPVQQYQAIYNLMPREYLPIGVDQC